MSCNPEIFKKAPNLLHFLEYVAEQHFAGKADQIKEYSIAVQALHRPEQFDPQSDTIVRVTAHALRKKLENYYATEGASHQVQIHLPPGKYVLQFIRKPQETLAAYSGVSVPQPQETSQAQGAIPTQQLTEPEPRHRWGFWPWAIVLVLALLAPVGMYLNNRRQVAHSVKTGNLAPIQNAAQEPVMRIRFGMREGQYVDAAGQSWAAEKYCQGGALFTHPGHEIQGTDDPVIFQEGREGKFQCKIPAPPGTYQLLLLFADTAGDKEAARQVDFTINNRRAEALDIVDEAGGDDIAIGKIYTGIQPMQDGAIHLDFYFRWVICKCSGDFARRLRRSTSISNDCRSCGIPRQPGQYMAPRAVFSGRSKNIPPGWTAEGSKLQAFRMGTIRSLSLSNSGCCGKRIQSSPVFFRGLVRRKQWRSGRRRKPRIRRILQWNDPAERL